MENICCSAHGLSLLVTGVKDDVSRTMLFDTGPEGRALELNARRLKVVDELGDVERVVLSHWHRDHSGGMVRAVEMVHEGKRGAGGIKEERTVVVDLHPNRPEVRGVKAPSVGQTIALGKDPTFGEIEDAGAVVEKSDQPHAVLGGMFVVSGEIPRVTDYEVGLRYGVRLEGGRWVEDCLIRDERLVMCRVKGKYIHGDVILLVLDVLRDRREHCHLLIVILIAGKGIVVFTGCSHAGVVNAARHAVELGGGDLPLYAVMGGYHLADAEASTIQSECLDRGAGAETCSSYCSAFSPTLPQLCSLW
jgi:7,8-dihydropterin-6-yl-methyl-4-(beta-D-ribofuranosyl)aminobenzene 5'-phosphate synthase